MSASNGIELEIPRIFSRMRSLLLHTGCCSLLPTAPVALIGMLDAPSHAVGPALSLVYACMLSLPTRESMIVDDIIQVMM